MLCLSQLYSPRCRSSNASHSGNLEDYPPSLPTVLVAPSLSLSPLQAHGIAICLEYFLRPCATSSNSALLAEAEAFALEAASGPRLLKTLVFCEIRHKKIPAALFYILQNPHHFRNRLCPRDLINFGISQGFSGFCLSFNTPLDRESGSSRRLQSSKEGIVYRRKARGRLPPKTTRRADKLRRSRRSVVSRTRLTRFARLIQEDVGQNHALQARGTW